MLPSAHVGSRIKLYRTQKRLTLDDLAKSINKSPSTLSKYETGRIAVDVNTLFEISDALGVSISQLTDYQPQGVKVTGTLNKSFFKRSNLYYSYVCFDTKKISVCAMEVVSDSDGEDRFVLYFDISDPEHYTKANYIYCGSLFHSDSGTAFHLENPYNHSDVGYIYTKSNFSTSHIVSGIFTFVPQAIRNPVSTKIIFSLHPLDVNDDLVKNLLISDKETISSLKKKNLLVIY